jgi:hypothetical protein
MTLTVCTKGLRLRASERRLGWRRLLDESPIWYRMPALYRIVNWSLSPPGESYGSKRGSDQYS